MGSRLGNLLTVTFCFVGQHCIPVLLFPFHWIANEIGYCSRVLQQAWWSIPNAFCLICLPCDFPGVLGNGRRGMLQQSSLKSLLRLLQKTTFGMVLYVLSSSSSPFAREPTWLFQRLPRNWSCKRWTWHLASTLCSFIKWTSMSWEVL